MHHPFPAAARRGARLIKLVLLGAGLGLALASCGGSDNDDQPSMPNSSPFVATNVVTDAGSNAPHVDPNLVNGWGVAFNPTGFVWVANQGTSTSTLYDGKGVVQSLVVAIPAGAGGNAGPTGIVYNGTQDFKVTQNGVTGAAPFLFVGTGGTVSGWSPAVNRTNAITMVDTAAGGATPAAYTGLALGSYSGVNYLYAADFRNGRVDVYDPAFKKVTLAGGSFNDPNLPSGYAPYGIQAVGSRIYVSYAQHATGGPGANRGAGLGIVNAFDPGGALIARFATGGALNAPWGMALAPANFGNVGGMLLVGNFGDGTIHAFDPATGRMTATLSKADKTPIVVDGLWGIAFGNGVNDQPANALFYAAGPNNETHGLYGRIDPQ